MSYEASRHEADSKMIEMWWNGARAWYNEHDYQGAMNEWSRALSLLCKVERHAPDRRVSASSFDEVAAGEAKMLSEFDQALSVMRSDIGDNDAQSQSGKIVMAPLWLFLAGCWLDAQDFDMARRCLRVCIRDCCFQLLTRRGESQADTEDTLRRAIVEYMSSFEEQDPAMSVAGRQVIELARSRLQFLSGAGRVLHWTDSYQRPGYLHPDLPSKPFYFGSDRPSWCVDLEAYSDVVLREFQQLYNTTHLWPRVGQSDHREGSGQHDGRVVRGGDWREVVLFGTGSSPHGSHPGEFAPLTRQWIRAHLPEAIELAEAGGGEVIFSVLQPHTTLLPHCATTNLRLTAHLALSIPSNDGNGRCRIRVGSQWENWQRGKVLVFDDSFEHEVENTTDQMRAVLLIRFWHPQLRSRMSALENALRAKRLDQVQRYNPPFPGVDDGKPIRQRALDVSRCPACWRSGYGTIRLYGTDKHIVATCSCGEPIDKILLDKKV
jgi:aspartate beta-hydroxylase